MFKIKKINYFIERIVASGLIDFLVENLNPSCVILFGSIRKGESVRESDIDLLYLDDKVHQVHTAQAISCFSLPIQPEHLQAENYIYHLMGKKILHEKTKGYFLQNNKHKKK